MTTFDDCLRLCANEPTFVDEYDRLTGSNLSMRGTPLDLLIDKATGRTDAELIKFARFVWECVWVPFKVKEWLETNTADEAEGDQQG